MTAHEQNVLQQFDPQAAAYLASAVHAAGPDLLRARELAAAHLPPGAVVLDVGCGAGHLAFALAHGAARVVAADPAPSMLAAVRATATTRGLEHLETVQAAAGLLPFDNGQFCLVASRFSAHHWLDVPAALAELRRVVKPGGYLLMIDVLGHDTPLVDTHLQAMELLRDAGHVRNLDAAQWRGAIEAAGFALREAERWPLRLAFDAWVERMRTPAAAVAAVRMLQQGAPREVRTALGFEPDGSFSAQVGLFWARAAGSDR